MRDCPRSPGGGLLLALAGGASGLVVGAACQVTTTAGVSPPVTVSAPVTTPAPRTPPAAVTMLAPVGAGAPLVASVVPTSSARPGQVELVAGHPVVAAALEPALLASQRQLFSPGLPVGDALGGVLREGQAVQLELTLPAGCYAAVGLSPSVAILGLELTATGSEPQRVRSSQGVASLGGSACVPLAAGLVRLRLIAVSGAGPAVARLFAR